MPVTKDDLDKLESRIKKIIQDQTKVLLKNIQTIYRDTLKDCKKRFSVIENRITDLETEVNELETEDGAIRKKMDEWKLQKEKEKMHEDDKKDDFGMDIYH